MTRDEAINKLFGNLNIGDEVIVTDYPYTTKHEDPVIGIISDIQVNGSMMYGFEVLCTDADGRKWMYVGAPLERLKPISDDIILIGKEGVVSSLVK